MCIIFLHYNWLFTKVGKQLGEIRSIVLKKGTVMIMKNARRAKNYLMNGFKSVHNKVSRGAEILFRAIKGSRGEEWRDRGTSTGIRGFQFPCA